ncbi:MAG TPA: MOSC domain-containing protein [Actinomycetota bacterium]|nr:MOSC domain-containing protein [Actinomycetota bacterium]
MSETAIEPHPTPATTWQGAVAGIYIATDGAGPMVSLEEIEAVAGKGLRGDRYFEAKGTYTATPGTGRQITLIEQEAVEAAAHDYGIALQPGQARRNIVTVGVALNHLVEKEFLVGQARLRGMRLCEPCAHLASLSKRGVVKALIHRGGLRADILVDGVIRVGDPICPAGRE